MKTKTQFYWPFLLSLFTLFFSSLILSPPLRGGHFQASNSVIRRYKRAAISDQQLQGKWNQYRQFLNHEWEQVFSVFVKYLDYENKIYFVEFIFSELKKVDVKELSADARTQLLELVRNSITTEQLQTAIEKQLMFYDWFKAYFTLGLGNFSVLPVEQLTIDDKTYPIAQLFQEISKNKVTTFFGLNRVAANQLLKLFAARIFVDKVRETLLQEYWNQLRSMLDKNFLSLPAGTNNLSFRNKNINGFDTLFNNRDLTFDKLPKQEQKLLRDVILNQENSPSVAQIKQELQRLRADDISPTTPQTPIKQPSKSPVKNSETSPEDVTNQEKSESEQTSQSKTTKVSKSKTLTITLASVGGTVVLAGISGFLYWFLRIRK